MMDVPQLLIADHACSSLLLLLATASLYALWGAVQALWLRPRRIRKVFEAQGIKCLPRPFPSGNLPELGALTSAARSQPLPTVSHDIAPRIFPHYFHWSKQYGELFVYWFGSEPRLMLRDPELAKDILNNKFGHYGKTRPRPDTKDLIGNGLVTLEGEKWAQHRRILNPAFFLERLKGMAPTMAACTVAMMESWKGRVDKGEDIDVHENFRALTGDIIAHTAFGSSYAEGKQVFEMQHEQQILFERVLRSIYIPGSRFVPTSTNRYRWKLNGRIVKILTQLIEKRMNGNGDGEGDGDGYGYGYGQDLLGLMMAANKGQLQGSQKNLMMGIEEIIDECKTFFFAGHETTSTLLTWAFLLLATNPEWQERAREEVHAVCGTAELPTAESVQHLKLVGMVLNEVLRLYPPVSMMVRKAASDMQLGPLQIPAGTVLLLPVLLWQHDPRFWGPDAHEFRPDRFGGGLSSAASVPAAFMPFSMGPRHCIGQTFALLEAKVVLCCVLQRYRFRLSPAYKHAPTTVLTLQPQFGMPLLFHSL